jgi:hypothetical protein
MKSGEREEYRATHWSRVRVYCTDTRTRTLALARQGLRFLCRQYSLVGTPATAREVKRDVGGATGD